MSVCFKFISVELDSAELRSELIFDPAAKSWLINILITKLRQTDTNAAPKILRLHAYSSDQLRPTHQQRWGRDGPCANGFETTSL